MKSLAFYVTIFSFLLGLQVAQAQKVSANFHSTIKENPGINIINAADGNFLVFGYFNFYENAASGSIIKVDGNGKLVAEFQKVFLDQAISKAYVLPSGKILIQGRFAYLNGKHVGNMALLNSDGSVDLTFAINKSITINDFAVQSSGKIIIGYRDVDIGNGSFDKIARVNSNGTTDISFSTPLSMNYINRSTLDNLDRLYVSNGNSIARLLPDGAVDNTFSVPGVGTSISIEKMIVQSDGKLILSVNKVISYSPYTLVSSLQRHHTSGLEDNTFVGPTADAQITRIVLRGNGKIAITGYFFQVNGESGNVFEINSDGTVNKNLLQVNGNGMLDLIEDGNGNLLATGDFTRCNSKNIKFVAKIKEDYSLDQTFKLPVSRMPSNTFYPLAIEHDGKLLVGGNYSFAGVEGDTSKFVRVNINGTLDKSFKVKWSTDPWANLYVSDILVQEDSKIIVAGANLFGTATSQTFNRLLPDGSVDQSFQIGYGPMSNDYSAGYVEVMRMKDSKIFIAGRFDQFNLEPYQSFAILDTNGKLIDLEVKNSIPRNSYINDIAIQSDGKVILMGSFPGFDRNFIRLNVNGSIDNSFTLNVEGNVFILAVDSNDKILVGGNNVNLDGPKILLRFNVDGSPDTSFDLGSGFSESIGVSDPVLYNVTPMENGMIAVGGFFDEYQGISSPGLVILSDTGDRIPFDNPFDPRSFPMVTAYANNTLVMVGRFTKSHGQQVESVVKVFFEVDNKIESSEIEAVSGSAIQLSWTGKFSGAENILIERSTTNALDYETIATLPLNAKAFLVEGLDELTPYYFRVTGVNEFYSSSFEGKDTTFIKPEIALEATDNTTNSFVANWQYIPGTDSCQLQISTNDFVTFINGYENLILKTGTKLVTGLEAGILYKYRVRRFKNGKSSEYSNVITANMVVGADEKVLDQINVYPNPTGDYIHVNLPRGTGAERIAIYSSNGTIVLVSKINEGKSPEPIDLRNLPHGFYVLKIDFKNSNSARFKIFKVN